MKRIALIVFTAMVLHGCHQGNNTTTINVNPALKAAFNYQVGTYWIYQDSLSGEVDSFFVQLNSDTYFSSSNCSGCPVTETESIFINVIEYNNSPKPQLDTQYWQYYYSTNVISIEYGDIYYPINIIVYSPLINYPYDSVLSGGGLPYSDTGKIINTFNQLVVNSQNYQNVIEVNHFGNMIINATDYTHNDTLFVAPSIGLIKMILHHPLDSLNKHRVWELQKYHIVK